MKNEHLVPDIIKDLCNKFINSRSMSNESISLEDRLIAIRDYINIILSKKKATF